MTFVPSRTIILRRFPPMLFGAPVRPALRWPVAEPGDVLDYALDLSALLAEVDDSLISVSVAAAPSGAGELVLSDLSAAGGVITVYASGGVLGRTYLVRFLAVTLGGRTFELLAKLPTSPLHVFQPPAQAADPEFGEALVWFAARPLLLDLRIPLSAGMAAALF